MKEYPPQKVDARETGASDVRQRLLVGLGVLAFVFILLGGANTTTFRIGTTIANDHDLPKVPLIGQPAHDGSGLFDDGAQR